MDASDTIIVGKFGAPYGIKGWLKINSYTDDPAAIFEYAPWIVKNNATGQSIEVSQWRTHNNGLVVKLVDVDDRNAAEVLKNVEIHILESQLPALADDEFYWRDLVDMNVVNEQGYRLGVITEMFETGSNDVMRVKANAGDAFAKTERLIPFIMEDCVKSVDRKAGTVTVNWDPDF